MANDEHVRLLYQGVAAWNSWRADNYSVRLDLTHADLTDADLCLADLTHANLTDADLTDANLTDANLTAANLTHANLTGAVLRGAHLKAANLTQADLTDANLLGADLRGANLTHANLTDAEFGEANLSGADLNGRNFSGRNLSFTKLEVAKLREANLTGVNLSNANLYLADLSGADLSGADLRRADLRGTDLSGANLSGATLTTAMLVNTNFAGADLTGCRIYGVSAWNVELGGAKQQDLVITDENEPVITVDNIEVAQFIYLMLNNQKIRDVIDTITSKAVLILGRFTDERKAVLDALREELRKRDYLTILFDFEKPRGRDPDETITLLARMARFVIADISDAKAVLQELRAIVPDLPSVPVQSIILATQEEPGMFDFYRSRPSFLTVYRYADQEQLLADLGDKVIRPAELKVREFRG